MQPALLILAAGMGSRYGGLKQLEAVGPGGATLMDYTVFDALRVGFGRVVFVIRPELEADFRATIGARYAARVPVDYAFQRLDGLPAGFTPPAGRTKPWGTGQAVLAAAGAIREPCAVVNADDFYGLSAFESLAAFFRDARAARQTSTHALVGYALRATMSDAGSVNRAICKQDREGYLVSVEEVRGIRRDGPDGRVADERGARRRIPGDTPVSMNFWGFMPSVFDVLEARFRAFLEANHESTTAEYYIPTGIQAGIDRGELRVRVLPGGDNWCGMTYPQDKDWVASSLRRLHEAGVYPDTLWTPA